MGGSQKFKKKGVAGKNLISKNLVAVFDYFSTGKTKRRRSCRGQVECPSAMRVYSLFIRPSTVPLPDEELDARSGDAEKALGQTIYRNVAKGTQRELEN